MEVEQALKEISDEKQNWNSSKTEPVNKTNTSSNYTKTKR